MHDSTRSFIPRVHDTSIAFPFNIRTPEFLLYHNCPKTNRLKLLADVGPIWGLLHDCQTFYGVWTMTLERSVGKPLGFKPVLLAYPYSNASPSNKYIFGPHKGPLLHLWNITVKHIQSNLDGSNTDGSFTMANSNLFLSPYEILPIAQENKYLRKFSYFIVKLYVECTH